MTNTAATPISARLHYLELGSPDPERLARFYADALGMTLEGSGAAWSCLGPNRRLGFVAGAAKTLVSAGYRVANRAALDGLAARLADAGVPAEPVEAAPFGLDALSFRDPDGNRMVYGVADRAAAADANAGLAARLQHLVMASRNASALVDFYTKTVGLRESDRVLDDEGGLRTCFMRTDNEHHSFAVFQAGENRLDHHCYEVADWNGIRDWGDRFAALRVPVKWGPGRHGPGHNLFLFIHDPDGNWVEFSAELETVDDARPVGQWRHEERTLNSWGQGLLRS